MNPQLALKLVPILEAYFQFDELREFATLFDVPIKSLDDYQPRWLSIARELTEKLEHGNARALLDSLIDLAESRNFDGVAHSTFERQAFHQNMAPAIGEAKKLLEAAGSPAEITVPAGSFFTAKSLVRELLETATTDILVVDPYVGVGTLDCLRNIKTAIRLLTGSHGNSIEKDFDRAIAAFKAEGHHLEVRQGGALHDRHLIFNGRCWMAGSSLKDAGKKQFNCIEVVDKGVVVADVEGKWAAGTPYPP